MAVLVVGFVGRCDHGGGGCGGSGYRFVGVGGGGLLTGLWIIKWGELFTMHA